MASKQYQVRLSSEFVDLLRDGVSLNRVVDTTTRRYAQIMAASIDHVLGRFVPEDLQSMHKDMKFFDSRIIEPAASQEQLQKALRRDGRHDAAERLGRMGLPDVIVLLEALENQLAWIPLTAHS